jgi:hypothetical protein
MFKDIFLAGLSSSIFGTLVSVAYIFVFKYSPLEADFTENATLGYLLSLNVLIGMSTCFLYFTLIKLLKKENIASFLVGIILSGASIAIALLFMFKVDNQLVFKNENAELYKDFYYFILAPISFFSGLSWFTFKPLFIK